MDEGKLGVVSEERLKLRIKSPVSANRKSYMPRQLAQQSMTPSDLEWPFHIVRCLWFLRWRRTLDSFFFFLLLLFRCPTKIMFASSRRKLS